MAVLRGGAFSYERGTPVLGRVDCSLLCWLLLRQSLPAQLALRVLIHAPLLRNIRLGVAPLRVGERAVAEREAEEGEGARRVARLGRVHESGGEGALINSQTRQRGRLDETSGL